MPILARTNTQSIRTVCTLLARIWTDNPPLSSMLYAPLVQKGMMMMTMMMMMTLLANPFLADIEKEQPVHKPKLQTQLEAMLVSIS